MNKEAIVRLNSKQLEFHQRATSNQADFTKEGRAYQSGFRATFQGGRGSGKSRTLIHLLAESAFQLPRAKAGLAGLTYRQVQDIILSQSNSVFEELGCMNTTLKPGLGTTSLTVVRPSTGNRPTTRYVPTTTIWCLPMATLYNSLVRIGKKRRGRP
ncbi:hypothetical protein [Spirosoma flavum]|uniref:Phage terminase large subunit N-terminal domain-containing protein n=1 Tax=Spirosoma flavum TaxID=2048557 RepID=A0ABW6AKM7_9BACT